MKRLSRYALVSCVIMTAGLLFQNCSANGFSTFSADFASQDSSPNLVENEPPSPSSTPPTSQPPASEIAGKYLSYVATQAVSEAVFLQIGTLYMNENGTASGIVWAEDTRSTDYWVSVDSKLTNPMNVPDPSLLKSAGSCSPGHLKMPGLIANPQNLNGTWTLSGEYLRITLGSLVMTWQKDDSFTSDSWKLIMATGYWNTYGYAFLSQLSPLSVTAPLADNHLAASYSGNMDHNNTGQPFGTWTSYPLGISWFGRDSYSDPDVVSATAYTNPSSPSSGDGSSIYGFYNLYRNDRNRSRNMLFEYFGHDYNDDGCANESGGHARMLYGVFDDNNNKITRMLMIESSGPNSGAYGPVPIISVGRATK